MYLHTFLKLFPVSIFILINFILITLFLVFITTTSLSLLIMVFKAYSSSLNIITHIHLYRLKKISYSFNEGMIDCSNLFDIFDGNPL